MLRFFLCFYCSVFSFIVLKLKKSDTWGTKQNALSLKSKRRSIFLKRRKNFLERRFNFIFRAFVNCFFCKTLFISVVCGRECRIYSIKCKVYLLDWKIYCTFAAELKNVSFLAIYETSVAEIVFWEVSN